MQTLLETPIEPVRNRFPALLRRLRAARVLRVLLGCGAMMLCLAAGYVAQSYIAANDASGPDPFTLGLSVLQYDDSLHVNWNRKAPAIKRAMRGILVISDGDQRRTVELNGDQLRAESVLYRHVTENVKLRLEVFPDHKSSISELWQLKRPRPQM